jgi:two-component system sensor histidine kinase KdpD
VTATADVVAVTLRHVSDALGCPAILFLPDASRQLVDEGRTAGAPPPDAKEAGVAQWAFERGQPAGAGTGTLPAAAATYVPLKGSRGIVGVLGVFARHARHHADERRTVDALASHAALAVERAALAEEARAAWERVEAEFLRNTLLSGVSHELRTPLAAITGAASTLTEGGDRLPPGVRAEMLDTIEAEAERMERLITNLLDMTRLESGGLAVKRAWQPLQEVIGSTLRHLDRRLRGRTVTTDLPADLPLLLIDEVALEQVLANLLDNAVEFAPADQPIGIAARAGADEVVVEVADRGPGLPAGIERRVFEKFFRARPAESRRGIGLGLAIAKGIVEAHGGRISAGNRPGGGAVFRFTIPCTAAPPVIDPGA